MLLALFASAAAAQDRPLYDPRGDMEIACGISHGPSAGPLSVPGCLTAQDHHADPVTAAADGPEKNPFSIEDDARYPAEASEGTAGQLAEALGGHLAP